MSKGIGLCLSGGGFRASFYHIGILAQMAEKGLLRKVEVISTVSGGSILGVAYYILLKRLLESKADADIVDQDYIDLVVELEESFRKGVSENIRMRTFLNPIANMRMALPNFSRSDQIGRLYTEYLYLPIYNKGRSPDQQVKSINMTDLHISPKNNQNFHPFKGEHTNQHRENKVPVLVVNSTSLNSGHDWVFTGSGMGEIPPRNDIFYDIDKKDRYSYSRYEDITTRDTKGFSVGSAVAASAGVPGLFPPMAVSKLYKDRTVQLVDGGVFDNQGIAGALWILEENISCDYFVVSDASGQGDATNNPETGTVPVLTAMAGILTSRVREEMVNSLVKQGSEHVELSHLTRGLFANRILINEEGEESDKEEAEKHGVVDSKQAFDVTQKNQLLFSQIRTDLDAFSEYEIYGLERDAYQMSAVGLLKLKQNMDSQSQSTTNENSHNWAFNCLEGRLGKNDAALEKQISIGRNKFFKTFRQNFILALLVHIPLIVFFVVVYFGVVYSLDTFMPGWWQKVLTFNVEDALALLIPIVGIYLLSMIADRLLGADVGKEIEYARMPYKGVNVLVMNVVLPMLISIPVWIFLKTVNPLFLRLGRVE
ncbi:MAG: patatin-like phospholipase family protein [Kangiellaceae bacterium]